MVPHEIAADQQPAHGLRERIAAFRAEAASRCVARLRRPIHSTKACTGGVIRPRAAAPRLGKITGTAERPRLAVFRSHKNFYAQIIDDAAGRTLVSASTQDKQVRGELKYGGNKTAAIAVGFPLAFGSTILASDIAQKRLSFYFSRPLPAAAIWAGKLLGALVISIACTFLVAAPVFLVEGESAFSSQTGGFVRPAVSVTESTRTTCPSCSFLNSTFRPLLNTNTSRRHQSSILKMALTSTGKPNRRWVSSGI